MQKLNSSFGSIEELLNRGFYFLNEKILEILKPK
jgi:hypothetical protein